MMEWSADKKSDWSGRFLNVDGTSYPSGKVLDAKPIGFEQGKVEIDKEYLKKYADLKWKSLINPGDTDGIIFTLEDYPMYGKFSFSINGKELSFTLAQILVKPLVFDEMYGLEGKLVIKNASENRLTPELFALKDMVLTGKGNHRFSAPLQALLWGYMDGRFKENDNPLENYMDALEFVKPIWGNMKGPRWEKASEIISRLNSPELIEYYIKKKIKYEYYHGRFKSPSGVVTSKGANCEDTSEFVVHCLRQAGYQANTLIVRSSIDPKGHTIAHFEDKGNIFIMDNGRLRGPYKSWREVPYHIIK